MLSDQPAPVSFTGAARTHQEKTCHRLSAQNASEYRRQSVVATVSPRVANPNHTVYRIQAVIRTRQLIVDDLEESIRSSSPTPPCKRSGLRTGAAEFDGVARFVGIDKFLHLRRLGPIAMNTELSENTVRARARHATWRLSGSWCHTPEAGRGLKPLTPVAHPKKYETGTASNPASRKQPAKWQTFPKAFVYAPSIR